MTNENPFDDYKVGSFYISDDETSFVHQYFAMTDDDFVKTAVSGEKPPLHQNYPIARPSGSFSNGKFNDDTTFTIENAYATLRHLKIEGQPESTIFIKSMKASVSASEPGPIELDKDASQFKIRMLNEEGTGLVDGDNSWILYTATSARHSKGSNPLPSITSKMKPSKYEKQNSIYELSDGTDKIEKRHTLYLYDVQGEWNYTLTITELEVIEDGEHRE